MEKLPRPHQWGEEEKSWEFVGGVALHSIESQDSTWLEAAAPTQNLQVLLKATTS